MSPQTPPPTPGSRDPQPGRSGGRPSLTGGLPRWSFWILGGVLALALLLPNLVGSTPGDELSYREFLDEVRDGNVESIEWDNNDGSIEGTFTEGGEGAGGEFTTNGPLEPSDADRALFAENDVDFKFDTPQGSWIP